MSVVLERRRNREDLDSPNQISFEEQIEEIEERVELKRQNGETGYISVYDDVWEESRQRRIGHIDLSDGMPLGLRELIEGFLDKTDAEDQKKPGRPALGYIATLGYHPPLNDKGEANQPFLNCIIGDQIVARDDFGRAFNRSGQESVDKFMQRVAQIIGQTPLVEGVGGPIRMDERLLKLVEQVPVLRPKL